MVTGNPTSEEVKSQLQQLFPEGMVKAGKTELEGAKVVEPAKGGEAPLEKSYSKEEWDKSQSSWSKQLNERAKAAEEALTRITGLETKLSELASQTEEQKLSDWLKGVEADGGDLKAAQRIVEAQKGVIRDRQEAEKSKKEWSTKSKVVEDGLKALAIEELIKTYELDPAEVKEKLLGAATPVEMENIALKAAREKAAQVAKPVEKLDPGISVPKGVDLQKLPPSIALGYLIEQDQASRRK